MTAEEAQQARVKTSGIQWWLVASTPLVALFTHYLVVLPHEFAHSATAWALGAKANPFDIHWGGTSAANVLLLIHIDENVGYDSLFDHGVGWKAALIAAAGPLIVNGGTWAVSTWLLLRDGSRWHPVTVYVTMWLMVLSMANVYSYIPLRCFVSGDISHLDRGIATSPWVFYVVGGYAMLAAMTWVFSRVLPANFSACALTAASARAVVLVAVVAIVFGYYGVPSLLSDDDVTAFMGRTSVAAIPVVIVLSWGSVVTPWSTLMARRTESRQNRRCTCPTPIPPLIGRDHSAPTHTIGARRPCRGTDV